jgi:hypothetical protein
MDIENEIVDYLFKEGYLNIDEIIKSYNSNKPDINMNSLLLMVSSEIKENVYTNLIEVDEDIFDVNCKITVTECCKIGPITDYDNYCPKCGKRINR